MDTKLKKVLKIENFPLVAMFILYLLLFISVEIALDDATLFEKYQHLTWQDHWNLVVDDYNNWSSRVLVNFIIHLILGKSTLIFTICNALVATLLSWAFSKLFVNSNHFLVNSFIVSIILLFPVKYLGSAGWMVTFMTYFWPMTFGFVALIPIAKIEYREPFTWYEYLFYTLSLIYAGNEEIELIVLLFTYGAYFIYYALRKRFSFYMLHQLLWIIASLIFTLTAPGNGTRSSSETFHWFPTYNMLDSIDKIDIGFFSTMQNVLFDNNLFILVITLLIAFLVYRKYNDLVLRAIGSFPFVILLLFGPMLPFFEPLKFFTSNLSINGLVTISTSGLFILTKLMLIMIFSSCFIISLFLILEDSFKILFAMSLLLSGVASRVAMGFSPTVYASGFRTATPLYFGLIAISVLLYSHALENKLIKVKENKLFLSGIVFLSILSFISFAILIN